MGLRWAWRRPLVEYVPSFILAPYVRLRLRLAVGMSAKKARAALAAWTPPEPLEGVQTNTSGMFNPYVGLFWIWPTFAPSQFGDLAPGAVGDGIGYFRGILFWKANQPCRPVQNFGPHYFTSATATCVRSFKAFFGIPTASSSIVDQPTWQAIQWCANNLPNRSL